MPKQARLSHIKSYRCYTIDEAAELTGISPRTIRNWQRGGLEIFSSARPLLVRGDILRAYIKAQREGRRIKTGLDEFYCCRCRRSTRAAGAVADCKIVGSRVTLEALCARCETLVRKPIAKGNLAKVSRALDIRITRQDETL